MRPASRPPSRPRSFARPWATRQRLPHFAILIPQCVGFHIVPWFRWRAMPSDVRIASARMVHVQFLCAFECGADLGRPVPACCDVHGAKRGQELELFCIAPGPFWQRADNFKPSGKMADRLNIRRPLLRTQAGNEPIAGCFFGQSCFGEVMGQQLRASFNRLRKLLFKHFSYSTMELLPPRLDQRIVERIFEQGMFEKVRRFRRL